MKSISNTVIFKKQDKAISSAVVRRFTMYAAWVVLFFSITEISSANSSNDSTERVVAELKAKAIRYDRRNDVYNAIDYYQRYILLNKERDVKLTYRLAKLYFNTRDYVRANQYFDSVIHFKTKKYPLAFYHKGIVCMNLEKYNEAIDAFTKFRKLYKKNDKYEYRRLAGVYIESSTWAKDQSQTDGEIIIDHPGAAINHANIDFSPLPVDQNTIIYGAEYADNSKNIPPVRQLYKAVNEKGTWKTTGLVDGEINNPEFNTGNAVISDDGERMYFTRSRKNWKNEDINEIYVSHYDGNTWLAPEKLPYPVNDENYTSTQPALGKNLRTGNEIIYFVSNRKGGKGGTDIWYTEYYPKTNSYKTPQDLDRGVNTIGDECCPFYDASNRTLYFSSKGEKTGLGGYDIYKAVGSTKRWVETAPLPKPINSSYDDYYYSILKNHRGGFFTSNRPGSMTMGNGGCCDDIFSFKISECALVTSYGTVRSAVDYDVYNDLNEKYHLGLQYPENNSVLPDVPVELYIPGEKEGDEILISKTTTDKNGRYYFDLDRNKKYRILVKNYGFFDKRVSVNTEGINCPDTLKIGVTMISYLPKVNVRINIYYDYDKYKLNEAAKRTIDTTLMPLFDLFPNAIVEIGSHTDSTGTDQYNMKLSQRRSESVVSYLISKGISAERLIAKGYGMRQPIAPNTNSDGTDNPAGRQLNRRTEIKIVGDLSNFNRDDE